MVAPIAARPQVVVLDDHEGALSRSPHLQAVRERVDLRVVRRTLSGEELRRELSGVPVVVAIRERTRLDDAALACMPDTELILQTGGHAYHVDIDAATRRGIAVSLGRGSRTPTPVVAELVFGLLIAWYRELVPAITGMRAGRWPASLGRGLHGRTIGVLGLGRHGTSVARLARAFGMDVLAWGPTLTPDRAAEHGAAYRGLDELLATVDVVTLHLRLSEDSRGLLGARELALMRSDAVLVNTSRGPIVDEAALVEALRDGRIAGALLDVFDVEPLPGDHPLRTLPNVMCTPHLGYTVDVAFDDFAATSAAQLTAYLDGELDIAHLLNPDVLDQARPRLGGVRVGGDGVSGASQSGAESGDDHAA